MTLVELLVVMILIGVLATIATGGITAYRKSSEQAGAASDVQSALRRTGERAISEGRTYCLRVDTAAGTFSTWRRTCSPGSTPAGISVVGAQSIRGGGLVLTASAFGTAGGASATVQPCVSGFVCIYFTPRGTASAGSLTVTRADGSGRPYVITVKGLTGRVSTQH